MGHNRRRSNSSSSSSSSSDSDGGKKFKKEKKDKKDKKDKHGVPAAHGFPGAPSHNLPHGMPPVMAGAVHGGMQMPHIPVPGSFVGGGMHAREGGHSPVPSAPPPGYTPPPPSGFRVPLSTGTAFPVQQAGQPVAYDADGRTPVYVGSAIFERAVHPCKIVPSFNPPPRVPYGGREHEHAGRYDLLPFDPATMEWVPTAHGQIPHGRRPVEGGYEENGEKLYHVLGTINGVRVPGKTGAHLVSSAMGDRICAMANRRRF